MLLPVPAAEGVIVKNGILTFPEKSLEGMVVNLSKAGFSFPEETPMELIAMKGKIWRGSLFTKDANYIFPLAYDSSTKEATFYCIWEESAATHKPIQVKLVGVFNPKMFSLRLKGAPMGWAIYFQKDLKFVMRSDGGLSAEFSLVGEIPIPQPAPKKDPWVVKIENGFVVFPDPEINDVYLDSLNFNFSIDSPPEILKMQKRVFIQRLKTKGGGAIYLIPIGYDSKTREISLLFLNNRGSDGKPQEYILKGKYNAEGTSLKNVINQKSYDFSGRLQVSGSKVSLIWANGSGTDLFGDVSIP
ncbi:MAG TPA: hypothetical protein VHO68_00720 [Bacteroidales bacterium]|nr:hypothetical protein [Bacteroidales bacterium]